MTITPASEHPFMARSSADFDETIEIAGDVAAGTYTFALKRRALDAAAWIDAGDVTVTPVYDSEANATTVRIQIEREVLAAALEDDETRIEGRYEVQWTSPANVDGVWLAGKFVLVRGL